VLDRDGEEVIAPELLVFDGVDALVRVQKPGPVGNDRSSGPS
jgi:hypothetical protein